VASWLVVVGTEGVGAQGTPDATRLFEEGRALADQGKYEEACERYTRSYELERGAGTMLNLGDCAEREGKLRRAWQMYDAAALEYDRTGKTGGAKFARERARALAPRLGTVVVRLAEPRADGLTVRIGGRVVPPAAEIVERVDAGAVVIEVGADGREPFSTTTSAAAGAEAIVEVPALRAMDTGVVVAPPERPPPPVQSRRQRRRVLLAAGITGAGAVSLGVTAVLAFSARAAYRDYEAKGVELGCVDTPCSAEDLRTLDSYFDRAALRADLATGFAIGGAVLLAGGAVLYLTAPRERVTVAPVASSGRVGVLATLRF
jgi:tetratricopeptide (TPR) repeat protein